MDTPAHPSPPDRELVDRVVAWHNRHWLTSPIDAGQVTGLGIVALPFFADAAAAERPGFASRLRARLRRPPTAFNSRLIDTLTVSRVAAFGWRHGASERTGRADWPLRQVVPCDGTSPAGVQWRYLRTAAIEFGSHRIRVLVGAHGAAAPVLGARFWRRSRLQRLLATTAGALLLAAGLAIAAWRHVPDPGNTTAAADQAVPAAATTHAAASAAAVAETTQPVEAVAAGNAASSDAAPAPAPPEQDGDRPAADSPATAAGPPAPSGGASAAAPAGTTWALATEPTRSRAGSQLRIMLMNAPTEPRNGRAHAELMQTESGWRAVLWPFATRDAADRVRQILEQRGVRVELIAF